MSIERKYENKNRFQITKKEFLYLVLLAVIFVGVFFFFLPLTVKNIVSDSGITKTDNHSVKRKYHINVKKGNKQKDNHITVFILDVSPSMLTKDDLGIRALNGIYLINNILKKENNSRSYLLCVKNSEISEYMISADGATTKNIADKIRAEIGKNADSIKSDIHVAVRRALNRIGQNQNGKIVIISDGYGVDFLETASEIRKRKNADTKIFIVGIGRELPTENYSSISVLTKKAVPYTNDDIFTQVKEYSEYKDIFPPLNSEGLRKLSLHEKGIKYYSGYSMTNGDFKEIVYGMKVQSR